MKTFDTKAQLNIFDIYNGGWRYIEGSDDAYANMDGQIMRHGKIVKQRKVDEGYLRCTVGGKIGRQYSHIMIANTWLDKANDGYVVDHLNNKKDDNRVCNLEFVSHKENSRRCGATGVLGNSKVKMIMATRLSDGETMVFDSQAEAGKALGINPKDINKQLRGKRKTSHGYTFQYLYVDFNSDEYIQMELQGYELWKKGLWIDE